MRLETPPTLHLIVGLPGSGKTTLARRLEHDQGALRLTPDEWITALYGQHLTQAVLDAARDPVEMLQWSVAVRALTLGVSVILDFGFWSRSERERFRSQAADVGARSQIHALLVPEEELWARLTQRNANLPPATFRITREQLAAWWALFEAPAADELVIRSPSGETRSAGGLTPA